MKRTAQPKARRPGSSSRKTPALVDVVFVVVVVLPRGGSSVLKPGRVSGLIRAGLRTRLPEHKTEL